MSDVCRVGRSLPLGPLRSCCTLLFKDGVVLIGEIDPTYGPSEAERKQLLAHFGQVLRSPTGGTLPDGTLWDGTEVIQPGTLEHFEAAVYQMPLPFFRMPGNT